MAEVLSDEEAEYEAELDDLEDSSSSDDSEDS